MKRAEIIKLIGICSINYRNWPEEGKEEATITLWSKMLEDTEYFIAEAAVEKFLAESVYPPTIADIRARIGDLTVFREKTPIEAWNDVKTAIRKYGWYREADAMQFLGGVTRKVVEAIGFRTLCLSENEMADRAHFLRVYETLEKRERETALMLNSTRMAMERYLGIEGQEHIRRIK